MNRRGLSVIFTGVMILVLGLTIIVIGWNLLRPSVEKTGIETNRVASCIGIDLVSVECDYDSQNGKLGISVKQSYRDTVELKNIHFVFNTNSGEKVLIKNNVILPPIGNKLFVFDNVNFEPFAVESYAGLYNGDLCASTGVVVQCTNGEVLSLVNECSDLEDNDGDGLIDLDDPKCIDGTEFESCNDGSDNDGDGWIDGDDPGCYSDLSNLKSYSITLDDESNEYTSYECSDGIDNDPENNDGIDAEDPDCVNGFGTEISGIPIPECSDGIDNDGDGFFDFPEDLGCDDFNDNTEKFEDFGHKRLLHYQTVGLSSDSDILQGKVSSFQVSSTEGWQAHVDNVLKPVYAYLENDGISKDAFDWYGNRLGGEWGEHPTYGVYDGPKGGIELTPGHFTNNWFESLWIAKQQDAYPILTNLQPLKDFADAHGMKLYGHIGTPRCDAGELSENGDVFIYENQSDQCDPNKFSKWYGEFFEYGFSGITHDASISVPAQSPFFSKNLPYLEANGFETFIEGVPRRKSQHMLGYSVSASEKDWNFTSSQPNSFTEQEILDAGGRTIHWVIGEPSFIVFPNEDARWEWIFETSKELLSEGKTVAVPLNGLVNRGYNITELVVLSKG